MDRIAFGLFSLILMCGCRFANATMPNMPPQTPPPYNKSRNIYDVDAWGKGIPRTLEACNERDYLDRLNYRKAHASAAGKEKYEQKISQYASRLQLRYEKRTGDRLRFLQQFYTDLYRLPNAGFTKKYKKCCSQEMLDEIKYVYRRDHGSKGYGWYVFTDNERHAGGDFRFTYLNADPGRVADKQEALYMFGDSVRQWKPKYRYTNTENKWFQVTMGAHHVMVQLDGEGKHVYLTGVINPYTRSAVREEFGFKYMPQQYVTKVGFKPSSKDSTKNEKPSSPPK